MNGECNMAVNRPKISHCNLHKIYKLSLEVMTMTRDVSYDHKCFFRRHDVIKRVGESSTGASTGPLSTRAGRHVLFENAIAAAVSGTRMRYESRGLITRYVPTS